MKIAEFLTFLFICAAVHTLAAQSIAVASGSGGVNRAEHQKKPYLVLVSFDGFSASYLNRFKLPNFDRVMKTGVRAKSLRPVYPSLTFPSHYSMVTGMYPERHGIVGMDFIDPVRNQTFSTRAGSAAEGSWYRGEPIWVTAERQGMVSATCFWPGSDAAIQGVRPTFWKKYDGGLPNSARVQAILDWLRLPAQERPHVLTAYFSDVDGAGHRFGPDSGEVAAAVLAGDQVLGALLDGINALPIRDQVILMIVSDHGMAAVTKEQTVPVDGLLDTSGIKGTGAGTQMSLFATPDLSAVEIRDRINARLQHGRAYLRQDLPEALHYRSDPRIGDVVIVMEEPWRILPPRGGTRDMTVLGGWHGWDPSSPAMQGIFLASGPGIRKQFSIGTIEAVDVYPIMVQLLGLTSAPDVQGRATSFGPALTP